MRCTLAVAVLCLAGAAARADVLVLADGSRVEGKLLDADAAFVRFAAKGKPDEMRPRKDVAAVLFFEAAKGDGPPASSVADRMEMDGLVFEGTLLRFVREPFGPFGMTKASFVDAGGKLLTVATPRRIASLSFGAWKAPPPPKPAKGAKPVKAAPPPKRAGPPEALSAAEKALAAAKPEADVPALLFASEAALALQSDDASKARLGASIDKVRAMLPEHETRRLALGDVRVEAVDFSEFVAPDIPGFPPGAKLPPVKRPPRSEGSDPDADGSEGPGIYVYAHLLSTTGELLGPTVRYYWRSKDGRVGFEEKRYYTKTSSADHAVSIGMSWRGHEIERVAVQIRVGDRVIDTREAAVAGAKAALGTPWWETSKDHDWPKHFVTHKDSGRDAGRVTDTFWERHAFEEGAVDEEEDEGK